VKNQSSRKTAIIAGHPIQIVSRSKTRQRRRTIKTEVEEATATIEATRATAAATAVAAATTDHEADITVIKATNSSREDTSEENRMATE
jgi:adenylate kinase